MTRSRSKIPSPPLRLVFYSGGQSRSNHQIHREVVRLAREARGSNTQTPLTLTYIPYMADGAHTYFERAMRRFRAFGIERFYLQEPDHPITSAERRVLLESDVIYLAGGNTYTFLHSLRRSRLISPLQEFARKGKVIAGLSAGGIILTPTIALAGIPSFDADENEPNLQTPQELKGLSLVSFEFSPHDANSAKRKQELLKYSQSLSHPIFAVHDGGGLVVEGDRISGFGKIRLFYRGTSWRIRK